MAFHRKESKQDEQQDRVIEISAQMQGDLSFKDPVNLRINGQFSGRLDCFGTLTIGQTAIVDANIIADNIVIAGKIKGNVIARKMLVLMPTANLIGDITTPKLNIVEGALFQGRCQMQEDYLTVDDLAQYLEIENEAIIDLAVEGKIPAIKEGDQWRFERSKIESWASSGKVK